MKHKGRFAGLKVFWTSLFLVLLGWTTAAAQSREQESGPTDPRELEAFLAPLFAEEMEKRGIPGAAFAFVRDGEVILLKGYGYADLEKKKPVDPEKTLFYLASVTKPFTATAVLQLVEQGRLDLHADVNRYLRHFRLNSTYAKPVTLAHLLTHTGGFDDKNIGYVTLDPEEVRPLGGYLAREMPPRVMPPGVISSYSNYGYGLAGYLVEVVSGMDYAKYVEDNILLRLSMSGSTASIPLPLELEAERAVGYGFNWRTGEFETLPLGYRNLPPAGTISATAADMAKFLIAHLEKGCYREACILAERTVEEMQRQQFIHHPRMPGYAFGFYERYENNLRALEHAGGYIGYSSLLFLLPEKRVGFFVAYNRMSSGLHQRIVREFLDHYYPVEPEEAGGLKPPAGFAERGKKFAGAFHWTRYARRSVEKIAIWDTQYRVGVSPEGYLQLEPPQGKASRWVQVEPLLFRSVDGVDSMAFRENETGEITHLFVSGAGGAPIAMEKLPSYDAVHTQRILLLSLLVVFFSACVIWPLAWLGRTLVRLWRRGSAPARPALALVRPLTGLNCLLMVIFAVGVSELIGNSRYRLQLVYGMTPEMIGLLVIPFLTTALTALMLVVAVQAWSNRYWSLIGRLYYSLVTLAALAFILFLVHWNLLGFRY